MASYRKQKYCQTLIPYWYQKMQTPHYRYLHNILKKGQLQTNTGKKRVLSIPILWPLPRWAQHRTFCGTNMDVTQSGTIVRLQVGDLWVLYSHTNISKSCKYINIFVDCNPRNYSEVHNI